MKKYSLIKCEELKERITKFLVDGVAVRPIKNDGCLLKIPFHDSGGDPIEVAVYRVGDSTLLTDSGIIAGHLFALGQHTQDTPSFKLLRSLERAYGLNLDFDNGRVTTTVAGNEINDAIMDFSKVILTMVTAIPHVRVEPHHTKLGKDVMQPAGTAEKELVAKEKEIADNMRALWIERADGAEPFIGGGELRCN